MAAKSKKRLCKNENKLLKLEKLQINDVICSVCQSILIEPVTLPCFHDFCRSCFSGSVENNALCCPLCRLRIGSWLRSKTKQKNLVNNQLWIFLKSKFSREIEIKLKGDDLDLPEEKPQIRVSAPGEIRQEYEAELKKLKAECIQLEQKHLQETELLIKKIQEEEEEAHKKYLESLKQDEILAQAMAESSTQDFTAASLVAGSSKSTNIRTAALKARLKVLKIDKFLCKKKSPVPVNITDSPLMTDDNTSSECSSKGPNPSTSKMSPEMVPTCSKYLMDEFNKRKSSTEPWNKENGSEASTSKVSPIREKLKGIGKSSKSKQQSLPVSLPYAGILQLKKLQENLSEESSSVDSMRQELCYFKPIEGTIQTSFKVGKGLPIRVPCRRALPSPAPPPSPPPVPAEVQCLEGLCRLRNTSLAQNLPSAFALALNIIRALKEISPKRSAGVTQSKSTADKVKTSPMKKQGHLKSKPQIEGIDSLNNRTSLRRTRSMGSISRGETTPKKTKIVKRKVSSERKPHLRSDTKKCDAKKLFDSPSKIIDTNYTLEDCHVKKILEEQMRIAQMIEQEKKDLELARKMDAELNGMRRRGARRGAVKRPPATPAALRPAKKLRVQ